MNPRNTSQDCSNCGKKVDKELSQRTHSCPHCSIVIDRDLFAQHSVGNAAINIKNRAVGHSVFKARACPMQWQGYETRSQHYSTSLAWEYVISEAP
ncbi:zinc ribbon domain-containing protein [Okeania sp. SIO2B3]|uniref:zinc ribbon domain-containing protein n=1 Tax=Okeania sp. SIO2B3 TaxID=2607784 RepID=UPI0034329DB5